MMESAETQPIPVQDGAASEPSQEHCASGLDAGFMECPVCGQPMPDLKGGKATICPACGFKDSCCY
jgi:membrane protease subunit (stomatin/prohibitin family)